MFNRHNLLIHSFSGKGYRRPEIEGVYFGKKETCATDTFMLARVSYPKCDEKDFPLGEDRKIPADFEPFTLPKAEAEKILKLLPQKCEMKILENAVLLKKSGNAVEVGIADLSGFNALNSKTIEGEFPEYKNILKKGGTHIRIPVDAKFLKKIADFMQNFTDSATNEVEIEFPVEDEKPLRFYAERNETEQKCEILLMPLRKH